MILEDFHWVGCNVHKIAADRANDFVRTLRRKIEQDMEGIYKDMCRKDKFPPHLTNSIKETESKGVYSFVIYAPCFENSSGNLRMEPIVEVNVEKGESFATVRELGSKRWYGCCKQTVFEPAIIKGTARKYAQNHSDKSKSFLDALISAGIPEEAIVKNKDLWSFVQRIEKNHVASKNRTFNVTDIDGQAWLLKINEDKKRSYMNAIIDYYLSGHFDFILAGKFKEPLEVKDCGLYITMHRTPNSELLVPRSLEYWVSCLASFHRDGERILRKAGIDIPEASLPSIEEYAEKADMLHRKNGINFDKKRLECAVQYLSTTPYVFLVHNDVKPDNLLGPFLVDGELSGMGHPGLDLAPLLMIFRIPKYCWENHLRKWLEQKGFNGSFDQEFKLLNEGMGHAAYCKGVREVSSLSLKPANRRAGHVDTPILSYLDA